jgi:hypothetical protein
MGYDRNPQKYVPNIFEAKEDETMSEAALNLCHMSL